MATTKRRPPPAGRSRRGRAGGDAADARADRVSQERRRLIALWLFALAPLAYLPGGFTRFVFPKLLVVALACLVAVTVQRRSRLPRAVTGALAVGTLVMIVAALAGQTPIASLVGRWPRYEGLPVLGLYAASVWAGARLVGRGTLRAIHLAHALAAMSLGLGLLSLLDVLGASPLATDALGLDRSGSLLGNATDQGLVAMMAAVVITGVLLDRSDPLLVAGAIAAVTTVALSGSRIALALSVAGALCAVVARAGRRPDRRAVAGLAGALVLLGGVALAAPVTRERLLNTTTGGVRLEQWRLTLRLVFDHPWLGLGPNRYLDSFGTYESSSFERFTGPRTLADSPHNLLLQVAVGGGLLLIVCLAALVWFAGRRAFVVVRGHPEAWGPAVAAAAYAVAMLANFTAAGSTCLAAFLAGAVLAEPVVGTVRAGSAAARGEWARSRLSGAVFAVAATLMAMSCVAEVRLQDGFDAVARGDAAQAAHAIGAAHDWRPLDADVAMLGAQATAALADQGDRAAATITAELAEQALRRTPSSYAAHLALGVALIAQGEPSGAVSALDDAVALFPQRPDAYVQRAIARYDLRDRAGARADLRVAARIEPRSAAVRRLLRRLTS